LDKLGWGADPPLLPQTGFMVGLNRGVRGKLNILALVRTSMFCPV